MKLIEFFEELAYGELSDLSMNEGDGVIRAKDQPKIVIRLNDVLNHLHTKYVIQQRSGVLDTQVKRTRYEFINPNAVRIVYIEPVVADPADIYKNYDKLAVQGTTVTFLKPPEANSFNLSYQWRPMKLKINPAENRFGDQEIEIDPTLVPLVRLLVAANIFTSMNGETHKATGIGLTNQTQMMIAELEMSGVLNISANFQNTVFKRNGLA